MNEQEDVIATAYIRCSKCGCNTIPNVDSLVVHFKTACNPLPNTSLTTAVSGE